MLCSTPTLSSSLANTLAADCSRKLSRIMSISAAAPYVAQPLAWEDDEDEDDEDFLDDDEDVDLGDDDDEDFFEDDDEEMDDDEEELDDE